MIFVSAERVYATSYQGYGLSRDVSGWSRDVLTSRLGQNPQLLSLGPMRLVSRFGRGAICLDLGSVGLVSIGSRAIASRRDVLCRRAPCINQHDICGLDILVYSVFTLSFIYLLVQSV